MTDYFAVMTLRLRQRFRRTLPCTRPSLLQKIMWLTDESDSKLGEARNDATIRISSKSTFQQNTDKRSHA